MNKIPKLSQYILIGSFLLSLIPIVLFICNVDSTGLSSKPSDWGDFGTFFMIPLTIFSLGFNGAILVMLNESVLNNNRESVREQILAQYRLTLNEQRRKALEEIISFLDSEMISLRSSLSAKTTSKEVLQKWNGLYNKHSVLFSTKDISWQTQQFEEILKGCGDNGKPSLNWLDQVEQRKNGIIGLMRDHSVYGDGHP